jgi:hypothetical protein
MIYQNMYRVRIVKEQAMPKKFTQANEARRRSRLVIGKVQGTRVIPDKRRRPAKHRKPLQREES